MGATLLETLIIAAVLLYPVVLFTQRCLNIPQSREFIEDAKNRNLSGIAFDKLPGPRGLPFFGSFLDYILANNSRRSDLFFLDVCKRFGRNCQITFLGGTLLYTADPVVSKKVLSGSQALRGNHLWECGMIKLRKACQPAFGPLNLRRAFTIANDSVLELLKVWVESGSEGISTRNVHNDFTLLSSDIIAKVVFSYELGALKSLAENKQPKVFNLFETIINNLQTVRMIYFVPFLWSWAGVSKEDIQETSNEMQLIVQDVVKKKAEKKYNGKVDLLDHLLNIDLSDEEIFGWCRQDTTSNTLTYILLELCLNERVYNKLRTEIYDKLKNTPPTMESLNQLEFLDAVIKETLRIHSVVPLFERFVPEDSEFLTSDGISIIVPGGTTVIIDQRFISVDKILWGDD
ncbi:Cytochrome P450 3A4, partial [Nowakowskiella sp. JEL0078]